MPLPLAKKTGKIWGDEKNSTRESKRDEGDKERGLVRHIEERSLNLMGLLIYT